MRQQRKIYNWMKSRINSYLINDRLDTCAMAEDCATALGESFEHTADIPQIYYDIALRLSDDVYLQSPR